jgi:hypothetical protein
MTYLLFDLKICGYGLGVDFSKATENYNPNKQNYKSDGSVKKFKFSKRTYEYSDWYFALRFFYNYTFAFRIFLNRG